MVDCSIVDRFMNSVTTSNYLLSVWGNVSNRSISCVLHSSWIPWRRPNCSCQFRCWMFSPLLNIIVCCDVNVNVCCCESLLIVETLNVCLLTESCYLLLCELVVHNFNRGITMLLYWSCILEFGCVVVSCILVSVMSMNCYSKVNVNLWCVDITYILGWGYHCQFV